MAKPAHAGGRRAPVCRRARAAPGDVEADQQKYEAEHVSDELPRWGREAEPAEQADCHPTEGEPTDRQTDALVPEASGLFAHRDDADVIDIGELLSTGREQEATENKGHTQGEESQEVAENDVTEDRWPVEGQECTDAAESEDDHVAGGEREPAHGNLKAINRGDER